MTTAYALHILRATDLGDLFSGAIVRDADEMGDDADLAECEAAAQFLGITLAEAEDGDLVVD